MAMTFYDRTGRAVAYTEDDVHIYLYSGHPAGYVIDGDVYSYSGRHLGTVRAGWVRDHTGGAVFFTDAVMEKMEGVEGGLELPPKHGKPPKLVKKAKPPKARREPGPPRPDAAAGWSELAADLFFTTS